MVSVSVVSSQQFPWSEIENHTGNWQYLVLSKYKDNLNIDVQDLKSVTQ